MRGVQIAVGLIQGAFHSQQGAEGHLDAAAQGFDVDHLETGDAAIFGLFVDMEAGFQFADFHHHDFVTNMYVVFLFDNIQCTA